jgi:hypothetical protein
MGKDSVPPFRSFAMPLSWLAASLWPAPGLSQTQIKHRFLALDNGLGKLHYVNQIDSGKSWSISTVSARDLQLIGNRHLLECVSNGYREYDLADGALKKTVKAATLNTKFQSARRLPDGTTVLGGNNETDNAILIVVIDSAGKELNRITFPTREPDYPDLNTLRLTAQGNYLFGNHDSVYEVDSRSRILWKTGIPSMEGRKTAAYKALRMADGKTLISAGSNTGLYEADPDGTIRLRLGSKSPGLFFFADFQLLPNGNTVIADWRGHGTTHGGDGISIHEFDKQGKAVWEWQDAVNTSSIQAVLILDDLDGRLLYDEREGFLSPAPVATGLSPPSPTHRFLPAPEGPLRLFDLSGRTQSLTISRSSRPGVVSRGVAGGILRISR